MHPVMGVCCIVFDIDGMLFEFFMNFLNIEKRKFKEHFVYNILCFPSGLCYFQHVKKIGVQKIFPGGGGFNFFFRSVTR